MTTSVNRKCTQIHTNAELLSQMCNIVILLNLCDPVYINGISGRKVFPESLFLSFSPVGDYGFSWGEVGRGVKLTTILLVDV